MNASVRAGLERGRLTTWALGDAARRILRLCVVVLLVAGIAGSGEPVARAQTAPGFWTGLDPGVRGDFGSIAAFGEGPMRRLYAVAGAGFVGNGWGVLDAVGRWDGQGWTFVGEGLPDPLWALQGLVVLDEGKGPSLFVFGYSPSGAAPMESWGSSQSDWYWLYRWNGLVWVPTPPSFFFRSPGENIGRMPRLSFNDGSGMSIYGVVQVAQMEWGAARWDGVTWHPIGAATDGEIGAMAACDTGGGASLYISGFFNRIGQTPIRNIAHWTGTAWQPLGAGVGQPPRDLIAFDDGGGEALYVACEYDFVIGRPDLLNIARWDGQGWSTVGGGVFNPLPNTIQQVNALHVFDDGRGWALYAAGAFSMAGSTPARNIARWNGTSWEALGAGIGFQVRGFAGYDDGRGPSLFAGGSFVTVGAGTAPGIAQWVGTIGQCYPDCDNNQALNVSDLVCYTTKLAVRDPYADCDVDGDFDAADLVCFQTRFAQGCP